MAARTKVFVDIKTTSDGKEPGAGLKKFAIGAGIAAVAIVGLIKIGKDLVNVYAVQEQAEARLEQTIKSTGKAAGLTADQLKAMASGLQGVTKFGDEAIIGAESLLLTFKDIGGDIFPRALESILDVSEAMGQGLKESTVQLGKALNDPIQGLTAMRRVGIQFTDAQEDAIKAMVKMNDIAGAQNIILTELESQFGGVARAAADTATGSLTQLSNTMGDLKEAYGRSVAEGIQPFVKGLQDVVTQMVEAANKAHALREALDLQAEDQATSAQQTLLILENQRDKLGQIAAQYEGLDEAANTAWQNAIRQVEDYNEALLLTDTFLIKATETEERRNSAIEGNRKALETYAQMLQDAMTAEELRLIQLQKEIDELVILKAAAKDYGTEWSGIETLLITLIKEKNELLKDTIEIIEELGTIAPDMFGVIANEVSAMSFEFIGATAAAGGFLGALEDAPEVVELLTADMDIMFGTTEGRLIKQKDLVEDLNQTYVNLAKTGLGAFAKAFEDVGAGNITLWEGFKEAGKDAVSALLEALAQMAIIEAALAAARLNFVSAGLFLAASAAAYAASGLVQSFAHGGQFITDGPTLIGNNVVGDNASGQERVTVEPLGGGGGSSSGGSSRETFRLVGPGNELLGFIQRVGINNGGLHSSRGKRL